MKYDDLRDFLAQLERAAALRRIGVEVDPKKPRAAITLDLRDVNFHDMLNAIVLELTKEPVALSVSRQRQD